MSKRHEVEARTIHPRALKELGEEACIVALGVARDLRSGVIPPEEFDMQEICLTPCCILGHIRINLRRRIFAYGSWEQFPSLFDLFSSEHPSDPQLAADAIERYVYDGSDEPWKVPAMTGG